MLLAGLALGTPALSRARARLAFPRDAGAHPDYATEWWYVTGHARASDSDAVFGFQVTFFRKRVPQTQALQSRFAAKQLIFAHAALTDVQGGKLWHDQRMARWSGAEPGQNLADSASASTRDTAVQLRDWSLQRQGAQLVTEVHGADFSLALTLTPSQPVLLQGDQGLSRKGPDATQTSYYYSLPQLQVGGSLVLQGQRHRVAAGSTAWLDHEWSQAFLPPQAVGWDWIGINFLDGSALTAFRLRTPTGNALWDGGSFRAGSSLRTFAHGEVLFQPLRTWQSPLSGARYPVEWSVRTPAGDYTVRALVDNQELDSRNSTGAIYWEGLCEVLDRQQRLVGRGYLEMTGYATALRL
ncbi:MAG: carotenoid 1,2-hydratase [Rhodoferax sp.]